MDNIKKTVSNFMKIKKFSSAESPTIEEPYAMVANEIALIKSKVNDDFIFRLFLKFPKAKYENFSIVFRFSFMIFVLFQEDRGLPLNNPHREREILESIESVYYSEHGFDSSEFELKVKTIPFFFVFSVQIYVNFSL